MKMRMVWLGLSLMIVVGLSTNRAPAQEPVPPPIPQNGNYIPPPIPQNGYYLPTVPPHVFVVPTTPYEPERHPYYPSPLQPRPTLPPARHATTRLLNHCGLACQADSFGCCGNFHSEWNWIFGSCRTFFGETCYPPQQHGDLRYLR